MMFLLVQEIVWLYFADLCVHGAALFMVEIGFLMQQCGEAIQHLAPALLGPFALLDRFGDGVPQREPGLAFMLF
jgi:hypothetical protein